MFDIAFLLFVPLGIFWLVSVLFCRALKTENIIFENYKLKAIGLPFASYLICIVFISILSFILGKEESFFQYLIGSMHSWLSFACFIDYIKHDRISLALIIIIMISAFCINFIINLYFSYCIILHSWHPYKKAKKIIYSIVFSVLNSPFIFCFLFYDLEILFFSWILGS